MNTIKSAASTNTILAIDLGKYMSVVCVHDEASGEFRLKSFETTRAELHRGDSRTACRCRPTAASCRASARVACGLGGGGTIGPSFPRPQTPSFPLFCSRRRAQGRRACTYTRPQTAPSLTAMCH